MCVSESAIAGEATLIILEEILSTPVALLPHSIPICSHYKRRPEVDYFFDCKLTYGASVGILACRTTLAVCGAMPGTCTIKT